MATLAEIQKESGEVLRQDTPMKVVGKNDDGNTLFPGDKVVDTLEKTPVLDTPTHIVHGAVDKMNGDHLGAAEHWGSAAIGLGTAGVVKYGLGEGTKATVTSVTAGATTGAITDYAKQKYQESQQNKDNQKSDDGNTAKMLTPELNGNNNPLSGGEKDTPQTNDDSKSAWEKFVENFIEKPLEWLGWKDKDTPESQPTEPNGQGETDPTGSGNGDNDNPNNPNSNPEPLQVPGAGGGFGAGLGNGNGAGTKDLGDPKTPFYDPLLIALQTGGNNTSISVVSHNEENGGKMLDLNGDGIANNVSWIGKDTGVLFYDENNNGKFDGIACNDKLYFQAA